MNFGEKYKNIKEILNQSDKVKSYDSKEETESDILAHSLLDIEESCNKITNVLLPKLHDSNINQNDIDDILLDLGEELKHIIYHAKTPKYYAYLNNFIDLNKIDL